MSARVNCTCGRLQRENDELREQVRKANLRLKVAMVTLRLLANSNNGVRASRSATAAIHFIEHSLA